MDHCHFEARLRRLGRRVWAVGAACGLGCGLIAVIAVVLAGMWSDLIFDLSPAWRLGTFAGAAVLGLTAAIVAARRIGSRARPGTLARRLDDESRARGQIVSGVDLLRDPRAFAPLEAGLARIAVERAEVLARAVPDPRVAPARPAFVSALAVGLLTSALVLAAVLAPRLALAQWLRFADPFGDHPPYSPIVFRIEPGDVRVVYGQELEVRAAVEGAPVDRLELVLEPAGAAHAERLPMFPEGDGRWRAAVADVTAPGRYHVEAHRARSARHRIDVITVPRLTAVRFRVTPPAYTRRSPYVGPLPEEGLSGLPGARVEIWASSNRPLASGTARVASPPGRPPIPLTPASQGGQEVSGSFEIREDATIEIRVRDVAGQETLDPYTAQVVLLRDERPFVRIVEPREVSFATPDVTIPVVLAAEDDYGITRVQLFRSLNGSRALPLDVSLGAHQPARWDGQIELPLSEYGLRAGDEIKLFARVEDNDPAGSKGSESAVVTMRIIPREVYERLVRAREGMEVLASKYREAARRMETLADEAAKLQEELSKLPPDSPLADEKRQALQALSDRLRDEAAAIRESAKHLLPYDIDRNLSPALEALAARLAQESRSLAAQAGAKNGEAAKELAALRERLAGSRKRFANDALGPVEHLARIYPLLEDQARFVQLYLRQRDLADRLASMKGHDHEDNPRLKARMRDLETEQKTIREALARLLDDIEDHARLLPDDPRLADLRTSAEEFVAAARASGASEAMADAEAGLAEFSGTHAHTSATKAADLLEALIARCNGGGGLGMKSRGSLAFQPRLAGGLGNSIEQMLAEAGLSTGMNPGSGAGFGLGAGNGFSSRQSNLDNVGLYGNLPTTRSSSRQGSGRSAAGPGRVRGSAAGGERRPLEALSAGHSSLASGRAEAAIPAQYRRRVADYFQRIADENGGR